LNKNPKWRYWLVERLSRTVNRLKRRKIGTWHSKTEEFFKEIYLGVILPQIDHQFGETSALKVLDAGCGTGRIAVELAKLGHEVTGIDLHQESLLAAQGHAKDMGVSIVFMQGEILKTLKGWANESIDLVICLEVLYVCSDYRQIIEEFYRVLKPGGLFMGSFRSRFYFITTLLRQGQYEKALYVAQHSEGLLKIASLPTYYNWHSGPELETLLKECGLEPVATVSIGKFSGMGYDGLAAVVDLDEPLSPESYSALSKLESLHLSEWRDIGRYMLAVGRKTVSHIVVICIATDALRLISFWASPSPWSF